MRIQSRRTRVRRRSRIRQEFGCGAAQFWRIRLVVRLESLTYVPDAVANSATENFGAARISGEFGWSSG
jgi:hypothetical protein